MPNSISKDEQVLVNTIRINLPVGIPFVEQQVQTAINISKKYLEGVKRKYDTSDNMYLHSLRVAVGASEYANSISKNGFHRYDLVIIALLHDVIEDADSPELRQELNVFKTLGNNKILEGIEALTNNEKEIHKLGKSKYMNVKFNQLAQGNKDFMAVKLIDRLDN